MVKLFRAFTARENYKNRDCVIVDWFCRERSEPVAHCRALVKNYHEMGEEERAEAQKRIDSFLTERELVALKEFIKNRFGFEVKSKELELPFENGGAIPNFAAPPTPESEGEYFDLHVTGEYGISVPICGFIDLSEPPNLISALD